MIFPNLAKESSKKESSSSEAGMRSLDSLEPSALSVDQTKKVASSDEQMNATSHHLILSPRHFAVTSLCTVIPRKTL